jgi:hypothetical protein
MPVDYPAPPAAPRAVPSYASPLLSLSIGFLVTMGALMMLSSMVTFRLG